MLRRGRTAGGAFDEPVSLLVLTDCLTEKADEGCLKVATGLSKRLRRQYKGIKLLSYGGMNDCADMQLKLNRWFANRELKKTIRRANAPVLYIPFASNTIGGIIRARALSRYSGKGAFVIFALKHPMNRLAVKLLCHSRVSVIALSQSSYDVYREMIGDRSFYLKTGVDTERFRPVTTKEKSELRRRYGIAENSVIVLHVGHLKSGRNVERLLEMDPSYYILLAVSSKTENEKEAKLRESFLARPNTRLIEDYLPHIEELYQMADLYLFPVQAAGNCIDVPLSVLEAAACDLPVVTTPYGELNAFRQCTGFRFLTDMSAEALNDAAREMLRVTGKGNREAVAEYDWNRSLMKLQEIFGIQE